MTNPERPISSSDIQIFLSEICSKTSADETLSEDIKLKFKNLALNGARTQIHLFEKRRLFNDKFEVQLFSLIRKIALTMTDDKERQVLLSTDNTRNASWLLDLRDSAFSGHPYLFSQTRLTMNEGRKKMTYSSSGYGISLTFDNNPELGRLSGRSEKNPTLVTISRTSAPNSRRETRGIAQ